MHSHIRAAAPAPQVANPSHGKQLGRAHFNTRVFAHHHSLGDPVAATWFCSHK